MSSPIGDRIKSARSGLSQQDFADLLGVSLSSLRRYESGERQPDADFITALYERRLVEPKWLLKGIEPMISLERAGTDSDPNPVIFVTPVADTAVPPGVDLSRLYELRAQDGRFDLVGWDRDDLIASVRVTADDVDRHLPVAMDQYRRFLRSRLKPSTTESSPGAFAVAVGGQTYTINPTDYRWIPFFDVEIAGGGGRVVDFASPPKKFNAYRKDYLESAGLLEAELFEASVVNDSMVPEIQHGEIILVNASDKVIVSGDVYVVAMGEEWICKYLRRLPGETIEVYSANAEVHKPFTIRDGEIGNGIEIVGKVYRQGRDRVRR